MNIQRLPIKNDPRDLCIAKYAKAIAPPNFIHVMFNDPVTEIPADLPDHPNLCKPIKIFNKPDTIDMIWTYVREPKGSLNNELYHWIGVTGLAVTKFQFVLRKIFKSIANGLLALHEAGYAHRNLISRYILIKSRNNAKVMGYSLRKDADQKYEMENSWQFYRAPRKPYERPDHFKDDVYALGRILMEAVCIEGPLQFPPEYVLELIPNKLYGSVVDLLTKMLALNQNERISMAEVAQHEWFNETYEALTQKPESGLRLITHEKSTLFKPFSDKMRVELKAVGIKILSPISGGSFGNVSRVRLSGKLLEKNGGAEIAAMKIANLSKYGGLMQIRETTLALNIHHPNIIKCLDLFTDGNRYLFIVMELAKCSLENVAEKHLNVTPEQAAEVAKLMKPYLYGVCKGIAFIHQSGWVHRDIKPANVVIKMDDVAAVCDFSFSRQMPKDELSSTWSGTHRYASPQLMMHKAEGYDPYANDVWSCGVTIYECLVGCHLVPKMGLKLGFTKEQMEIEYRKVPHKLINPKILSAAAMKLLMKMLRFDEEERFSMEEVLKHEFWNDIPKTEEGPKPGPSSAPDDALEPKAGPSRAPSGSEPEGRVHKKFKQGD